MILQVAAAYWPDADEVVVNLRSTEDDGITATLADQVEFNLLLEAKDQIGTKQYRTLNVVKILKDFARPDKEYGMRFRSPQARDSLYLNVKAIFGNEIFEKQVRVGISETERQHMDLPDNNMWDFDVLEEIRTGGEDKRLPENTVILAPEIRSFEKSFNFGEPQPVESYEPLQYEGGAESRLMLNSHTNSYQIQELKAPWEIPAYLFMEDTAENLITNSFLLTGLSDFIVRPQGWNFEAQDMAVTATLDFDHQTSSDAKIWKLRVRQNNQFSGFNTVSILSDQLIEVQESLQYCFSTYLRLRNMAVGSLVESIKLVIEWTDGTSILALTEDVYSAHQYGALGLASVVGVAPAGSTHARLRVEFYDMDAGDDIEVSFFAPQLEVGSIPSSRILIDRLQDLVTVPDYNAANQKIRFRMIPGFNSQDLGTATLLTEGPIEISFDSTQVMLSIPSVASLSAPLSFSAGDFLDLTFSHKANGKIEIYRDGNLLAENALPDFSATQAPLTIRGIGVELLNLDVFSRQ